jgi:hypothetical protein
MSAGYSCLVPESGRWTWKLATDFGETNVGDAIFSRKPAKGKLPDFSEDSCRFHVES